MAVCPARGEVRSSSARACRRRKLSGRPARCEAGRGQRVVAGIAQAYDGGEYRDCARRNVVPVQPLDQREAQRAALPSLPRLGNGWGLLLLPAVGAARWPLVRGVPARKRERSEERVMRSVLRACALIPFHHFARNR